MKDAALKLALDALEKAITTCFDRRSYDQVRSRPNHFINQAITAINAALAQPAQQPIGYIGKHVADCLKQGRASTTTATKHMAFEDDVAIYTEADQHHEPLSNEQIRKWWASENGLEDCDMCKIDDFTKAVRAFEAKLKERNT